MINLICYENIILYNGRFYTDKINIKTTYLHNRDKFTEYDFTPFDIISINLPKLTLKYNKIVVLIHHFHWNAGHFLWDHLYPSWYGLFSKKNNYINQEFQYITIAEFNDIHVYTFKNIIEKFSGSSLETLSSFSIKYNEPLIIPFLITGFENIGISHLYKENLLVRRGLELNNIDPIETFINHFYNKYNIKRNSLINHLDIKKCNNVIFIKNKRPYNGIEKLFDKMNDIYREKYNFKIIDYSNLNFEEQLNILNTTCLCIVGIGTARFSNAFLPNGSIEIQTFQPNINRNNYIEYFDYHGGTLSKYIKVKNIPYYTKEEAINSSYSHLLENYIYEALDEIPCKVPVNLEENIPLEIRNLKNNINYNIMFDKWRSTRSNSLEDFINIL